MLCSPARAGDDDQPDPLPCFGAARRCRVLAVPLNSQSDAGAVALLGWTVYTVRKFHWGCALGFYSRASFCASAICSAGHFRAILQSRRSAEPPRAADKLNHMCART